MPRQTIGRPHPRFFGVASKNRKVAPTVSNAPAITSNGGGDSAVISIAENTTAVTTVTSTNPNARTLVFYLSGDDAALFSLNPASGVLAFIVAPDYEIPKDRFKGNTYNIRVRVSDGVFDDSQSIVVIVTNVNEAPVITSPASIGVNEEQKAVIICTATDPDAGTVFTWSISGGADSAQFVIDPVTGVLTFVSTPYALFPADANSDNAYDVIVQVSDGSLTATKQISVVVSPLPTKSAPFGFPALSALNGAGKVISSWVIGQSTMTVVEGAVNTWRGSFGSQILDLIGSDPAPMWDAKLFGGRGGVVIDGVNTSFSGVSGTGGGLIANWPTGATDCWLLAAASNDDATNGRSLFGYGGGVGAGSRFRGLQLAAPNTMIVREGAGASIVSSSMMVVGAFTFGAHIVAGGNTTIYLNGVPVFVGASPVHTVSLGSVRLGVVLGTPQWKGAIAAAAILTGGASEADFLSLEAEFRSRIAN